MTVLVLEPSWSFHKGDVWNNRELSFRYIVLLTRVAKPRQPCPISLVGFTRF